MIKGKFRRGFNVSYDPKFLFSCDFISIPYSEAGTGVRTTFNFFFSHFVLCAGFFFSPPDFRTLDGVWRGLGFGSWLWEIPFGSGSLRIVSVEMQHLIFHDLSSLILDMYGLLSRR